MIPQDDLRKQERIYSKWGKGAWRVIAYCDEPSVTMENILTKQRETFGLSGAMHESFEPIAGLKVGRGEEPIEVDGIDGND